MKNFFNCLFFVVTLLVITTPAHAWHPELKSVCKNSDGTNTAVFNWFGDGNLWEITPGNTGTTGDPNCKKNNSSHGTSSNCKNYFYPSPGVRNGPTSDHPRVFPKGNVTNFFTVRFSESKITWKVGPSSAVAEVKSNTPSCSNDCTSSFSVQYTTNGKSVTVNSTKELSNVTLTFCDGTGVKKFEGLSGTSGTFSYQNKQISSVTVKAGCSSKTFDRQCSPPDCFGNYNGNAVVDQCGVCGGNGSTCAPTGVCVLTGNSPTSLTAKFDVVAKSVADSLVAQGLATYGDCSYTDICVNDPDGPATGTTKSVATITLQNWLNTGAAKVGECAKCPDAKQCSRQCTDFFPNDPHWIPRCVDLCVRDCGSFCDPRKGEDDCPYEPLNSFACAEVNGFLGQVNIATITNLTMGKQNFAVSYRDLGGNVKGSMDLSLDPNIKSDIPVSALGLAPDTYGTVCVQSEVNLPGLWTGSISAYKQRVVGNWDESGEFEYALHYPFENAKTAIQSAPLNTFSVGSSKVANWIRITDAAVDGKSLEGALFVYQSSGDSVSLNHVYDVSIPDGGRFDFSGHDVMDPDKVGQAIFVPYVVGGVTPKFYFNTARYFYECPGLNPFGCNQFLSAFVVPPREPTQGKILDDASIQGFDLAILELVNPVGIPVDVAVNVVGLNGAADSPRVVKLLPYQVKHLDVVLVPQFYNAAGSSITVDAGDNFVTAIVSRYEFTNPGLVNYGVASPLTKAKNSPITMTEFNSFLGQANTLKLVNSTGVVVNATVDYTDYTGNLVYQATPAIPANGQTTILAPLPTSSYGTITVFGQGLVVRNLVTKPSLSNPANNEFAIIHTGK